LPSGEFRRRQAVTLRETCPPAESRKKVRGGSGSMLNKTRTSEKNTNGAEERDMGGVTKKKATNTNSALKNK